MFRKMASNVEEISKNLKLVIQRVQNAAEARPKIPPMTLRSTQDLLVLSLPNNPARLVAVTKTKPVSDIQTAYSLGQRHFGENYVHELEEKSKNPQITEHCKDIKWHFIGHLQRNKSKNVALTPNLYMVETIDSQKLAQTLNNHWEKYKRPGKLKVMVQVNTSGEDNKSGCEPEDTEQLVRHVREKCSCLEFTGLMTIGAIGYDPANGPNPDFLALVKCRQELCEALGLGIGEVELSMGMSSDFEHAINLGSTNVRVGSTIFGARNNAKKPPADSQSSSTEGNSQSEIGGGASHTKESQSNQSDAASSESKSSSVENISNDINSIDLSKDPKGT